MHYYHGHEQEYQKRLAKGQVAWDPGDYDSFESKPLLEEFLAGFRGDPKQCRVLELGCGTGGLACFLAEKGFRVTAVDISESAIKVGKQQADTRGLSIDFLACDLCRDSFPEGSFQLVIDNHFLHCIVFLDERRMVLEKIQKCLASGGEYWLESMVGFPGMVPPPEWRFDDEGVTWAVVSKECRVKGLTERDGEFLYPIRRIVRSEQEFLEELALVGLTTKWHRTVVPQAKNETAAFQARCE
jgi:SAM-dependent methyltransferase